MTTYYVATLAAYVLVDAKNELDARERGYAALHDLYANDGRGGATITIRTVRPATDDEIELHGGNSSRSPGCQAKQPQTVVGHEANPPRPATWPTWANVGQHRPRA